MSAPNMVECDCELETITTFIHTELVTKHGFRAIQRSTNYPPGHDAHFDELRVGEIFPREWKEQLPDRVEILYRNSRNPKAHFRLYGSVNQIAPHHASSGHGYLDGSSKATTEPAVRKATYILSSHMHDSDFKFHMQSDSKAEEVRNPYLAVRDVQIALPVVKYTSSYKPPAEEAKDGTGDSSSLLVPHHLHSTKSDTSKRFHVMKEEKLATIVASIANDVCDMRELPSDVRPIDHINHALDAK